MIFIENRTYIVANGQFTNCETRSSRILYLLSRFCTFALENSRNFLETFSAYAYFVICSAFLLSFVCA
ncbi:hypothetical protein NY2A_b513L [Paramecium bursaria Chlorella virus NY2A]|uniref:Uncharacterized protein b513L n=1 Tax=Paramecium bursaria Chlorella virus NY2A TaxID=46021 RepID=A7IX38_PBCVN|nr:hypothetical protein NY2A_b513L [Paramecium bursaria Chlorella virus NY2A]ABT14912.1 hypothetical protein NY2A_b513L [Paramecium bursaria Chlorella virus NY2A]